MSSVNVCIVYYMRNVCADGVVSFLVQTKTHGITQGRLKR